MECLICGKCCTKGFAIKLEENEIKLFPNYIWLQGFAILDPCIHYDESTKKCKVHHKKPKRCQEYFCKKCV